MIENKRVLLICRESFSFPLFFIAKKLLAAGNEVGAFFIHPEEGYYNKCLYNQHTFYYYKEFLKEVKIFDLKELCKKFDDNYKNSIVDINYLKDVEQRYTFFKSLNLQLTSSQLPTRHYHTRFYFNYTTFQQSLSFLELGYKSVIGVLDDFKPEVLLDIEDSELLRTILNEIAYERNLPYINIDYPRFEDYKIPTYCLGVKTEDYLKAEYKRFYDMPEGHLASEYKYVSTFRSSTCIMSKEFVGTTTSQYKPDSLYYTFKVLVGKLFYFWNFSVTARNWLLIKRKQILYSHPIRHFLFYVKVEIKKQFLFRMSNYFDIPKENDDYVYMPLHLIPESTTFVKAPFYINELFIIEQVSKSLPVGWKLYVKEHQSMLGERSFSFYKAVRKFPNVKLVKFNYYTDPKPWIQNSKGVVTIAGTSAYEAAMLGKKSIVFADVPFTLIEGVTHVRSFQELPSLIASFGSINNIKSCASYLAAIKSVGMRINLKYLIAEGEAVIKGEHEITKEFENKIDQLSDFFADAFIKYPSRVLKKDYGKSEVGQSE